MVLSRVGLFPGPSQVSASPSSAAMYELAGETGLGVIKVVPDGGYGMA